jgi:hypothetical protein
MDYNAKNKREQDRLKRGAGGSRSRLNKAFDLNKDGSINKNDLKLLRKKIKNKEGQSVIERINKGTYKEQAKKLRTLLNKNNPIKRGR